MRFLAGATALGFHEARVAAGLRTTLICHYLGKQFEAGLAQPTNAWELARVMIPDTLGGLRVIHKRDTV